MESEVNFRRRQPLSLYIGKSRLAALLRTVPPIPAAKGRCRRSAGLRPFRGLR